MSLNIDPYDCISQPNPPINNHPNASFTATSSSSTSTTTIDDLVLSKLSKDLIFMEENLAKLNNFVDHVNQQISHFRDKIQELKTTAVSSSSSSKTELDILKKSIAKLKSQIPSNLKIHSDDSHPHQNPRWDSNQAKAPDQELRNKFEVDTAAAEFEEFFLGLPLEQKRGLFSLLKFPENAIIKKRLIIYWWIGVGIVAGNLSESESEIKLDFVNRFFYELVERGFIEPVSVKRSSSVNEVVDSCRIHPLIRSALTLLAERDGFTHINGDYYYFLSQPNFGSATLYDDPQLLSNIKNAKILHLGQWQQQQQHHIEVANIKFFDGLKNMKHHLTFLSLRGISLIAELPSIICELTNLEILDLKACYNLESLPKGIGRLQKLTHLDMSECYFLEHMPMSLASLQKLEVLKGFFIGKTDNNKLSSSSCTLGHLMMSVSYLRRLNIYTSVKDFPIDYEFFYLSHYFRSLEKLTISWGGCSLLGDERKVARLSSSFPVDRYHWGRLPNQLKKLDLQCFPGAIAPRWLMTYEESSLKKLYIRGGQLRTLPKLDSVEILRLRYLYELEMNWEDLLELFPNVKYLEKVDCPKLTGFPCDESGVWRKRDQGSK